MSGAVAGDQLWFLNGLVTILLSKAQNADGISLVEHLLPADFGPPLHVHQQEDETFYIVEGEFRFQLGDDVSHVRPGGTVYLPKGVPHGFRVISATPGRCLTITTGRFEDMLRAASRPAKFAALPEQIEPTDEMKLRLAQACTANGIDLIGPPID